MKIKRLWEYKDDFLLFCKNFHSKIWRATFKLFLDFVPEIKKKKKKALCEYQVTNDT